VVGGALGTSVLVSLISSRVGSAALAAPGLRGRKRENGEKAPSPDSVAAASATDGPPAPAATTNADPALPSSGGIPVSGHVRGAESAPVPRASVTLISLAGPQLGRVVAHQDGSYTVDAPGAGSYVLIASAEGYQPQASTVVVDGRPVSYDILLSGTSGLVGTVTSADRKEPIAGAMVVAADVRGDVLAAGLTDTYGIFSFAELVARPADPRGDRGRVPADRAARRDRRAGRHQDRGRTVLRPPGAGRLDGGEYTVTAAGYPPKATNLTVHGSGVESHDIELSHPDE
jgi:hypothetical protein